MREVKQPNSLVPAMAFSIPDVNAHLEIEFQCLAETSTSYLAFLWVDAHRTQRPAASFGASTAQQHEAMETSEEHVRSRLPTPSRIHTKCREAFTTRGPPASSS